MLCTKWLKQAKIIILYLVVLATSNAEQNDFLNQQEEPILTESEIDNIINNSINANTNIVTENFSSITYYDYYFIINKLHKIVISDLLDITEATIQAEEPEIEDDGKLIVNINLNYEDINMASSIYKKEHTVLFPVKDLIQFDVNKEYIDHGEVEVIDNENYVSLTSLPGCHFNLNNETQVIQLIFPAKVMKNQHFDATSNIATGEFTNSASGVYLNYDITLSNSSKSKSMTGIQDLNIFTEKGSGNTSVLTHRDLTGANHKKFVRRLETYWITENEEDLSRWTFGDSTTDSAPWSGSTRFGGVQYSSNFAIRPGIITRPLIDFNGVVESPTDISVYSNTQQIYNAEAKTGNFDINNIPITTGSGDLLVKLKDITGKIQTIIIPYYNTPVLLTPGLTDFSYAIGSKRRRFALDNNKYQGVITSFDYMRGINNEWTTGGHFESFDDIFSVGFTNINQLGLYGVIQTSLANTHRSGFDSQRGKIEYSFQGKKIGFFTGITVDRNGFADTFISKKSYFKNKGTNKSFQASISYGDDKLGSFFLSVNSSTIINENRLTRINYINGSYSKDIAKDSMLRFNCGTSLHKRKKDRENYATLSYTINLKGRTIGAGSSRTSKSKSFSKNLSISSQSETLLGWGYDVDLRKDDKYSSYDITVNNSSEIMDTSFYFFDFNRAKTQQVSFMGSVAEIDKSVHFSRPIENSIALVKTSNFKNIPVYVNNHLIGNTNSRGQILIPDLIAYYPSEIRMDANKVPMSAKFSYLNLRVKPRWKSGNIVSFDIKKQRSLQMKLLDSSHSTLEVGRTVKIDGIADDVFVGYNGLVYIEDIKNIHDITGTSCDDTNRCCSFNIPLNTYEEDEIIDLGEEICK